MEKVPGLKDLTFLLKRNKTHLPLAKMQASHYRVLGLQNEEQLFTAGGSGQILWRRKGFTSFPSGKILEKMGKQ